MNAIEWLELPHILDIHSEQLALFGGPDGVRDMGLLESALARPENKAAYGVSSIAELAAAYAFDISRNHPFIDGNKRTAFAAMIVFLELNGYELTAAPAQATATMLALAAGEIDEVILAHWIGDNMRQF